MIWLYSGTPGSGKSYCATYDAVKKMSNRKNNKVIANYPLNLPKRIKDNYIYIDNSDLTVDFLIKYSIENHMIGIEGQTLLIIDEAQLLFNSRDWNMSNRRQWITFFSQHRKFGFNVILIAQFDRMLDRQIRSLIEYEVSHLKVNNYFAFLPTVFLCVERWYGQNMKVRHYYRRYRKKYARLYNSYMMFDGTMEEWGF